jgi:hypothetical protein
VEMIGWIARRVCSELIPPSGPPFDAEVIAETARAGVRRAAAPDLERAGAVRP